MIENSGTATRQIDLVTDLIRKIHEHSIELEKRIKDRLSPYMRPEPPCEKEKENKIELEYVPAIQGMYIDLKLIKSIQTSIDLMLDRLEI